MNMIYIKLASCNFLSTKYLRSLPFFVAGGETLEAVHSMEKMKMNETEGRYISAGLKKSISLRRPLWSTGQ